MNILVKMASEEEVCQLTSAFRLIDKDGTGLIKAHELSEVINRLQLQITEEDIKKIHDVLKYYDGPIENISNDEPIKPTEEELNTLQNVLNNMEPVNIGNNPEQVETGKNMENAFIDYSNNMEINNNDVNQDNNEIRPEHKTLVYIKPNASN